MTYCNQAERGFSNGESSMLTSGIFISAKKDGSDAFVMGRTEEVPVVTAGWDGDSSWEGRGDF